MIKKCLKVLERKREVTIYLDAVWTLNFAFDMMLLMLTQTLARYQTRILRIMFGAFIASLLVPISLYFPNAFITTVYGKLLYSLFIILCTFKFKTVFQTIKQLALFYFMTFAIGGGLFALHFLFQSPLMLSDHGLITFNSGYGDPVSIIFVLIGFPVIWLFTKRRMDKHTAEKIRYNELCPVTIQLNHETYATTGYIDSGNQLIDPITKYPVIICDETFLKKWFTNKEWNMLHEAHTELNYHKIPPAWEKKIQIIPYQGVEGKSNFLLAIRPEKLTIYYGQEKILTHKVLIGIQFARLTKDETYHCLLHPQIIKTASIVSA